MGLAGAFLFYTGNLLWVESRRRKERKGGAVDQTRATRILSALTVGVPLGCVAGISVTLAAMDKKLRFVTVEQEDSLGGTVYHFPRRKLAMTAPMQLPIIGKFNRYEISKEELLEFWNGVIKQTGLKINFMERMDSLQKTGSGFIVKTPKAEYKTANVLLAIGRRGTPRKLGVPGEEQSKVVYRLIDAEQYRGQHVLVVGGGDSAAEAALAIAAEPGTTVTLSCRGDEIYTRPKEKNRQLLKQAVEHHFSRAGSTFFSGLEDQIHGAVKIAMVSQVTGCRQQHGHMAIVATSVHAAWEFAGMGEGVEFCHGQRVHVGTQTQRACRCAVLDDAHHARGAQPSMNRDTPRRQGLSNQIGGALFFKAQLGVGVNVSSNGRDFSRIGQDGFDDFRGIGRHRPADVEQTHQHGTQSFRGINDRNSRRRLASLRKAPRMTELIMRLSMSFTPRQAMQ